MGTSRDDAAGYCQRLSPIYPDAAASETAAMPHPDEGRLFGCARRPHGSAGGDGLEVRYPPSRACQLEYHQAVVGTIDGVDVAAIVDLEIVGLDRGLATLL